jgi:hypothetical protein
MILQTRHAAPVLLLLIISAALPSPILTQCSSLRPFDCTTCSSCTDNYAYWYSSNNNPVTNCGSGGGSTGNCVSSFFAIPCKDASNRPNFYASSNQCNRCSPITVSDIPVAGTECPCTSSRVPGACSSCADCISAGGLGWYFKPMPGNSIPSPKKQNGFVDGECISSDEEFKDSPCGGTLFTACNAATNTYTKTYNDKGRCSKALSSEAIAGLVIGLLVWLVNMILIGIVSRRKGLNPCPYIALACFFGVFAWFSLLPSFGAGNLIVSQGTPLQQLDSNSAPNPHT